MLISPAQHLTRARIGGEEGLAFHKALTTVSLSLHTITQPDKQPHTRQARDLTTRIDTYLKVLVRLLSPELVGLVQAVLVQLLLRS